MAKNSVADWDATAANNTDMGGISIQGTADVKNFDNALREMMAQIKVYSGTIPALATANTYTKIQKWAKGADVASATALTLGDDGNYFDITGTTTITSIATKGAGTVVKLHFDAALTLTHHATDLVLPGSANITTAAGDEAEFVEYATGDWRCTNYQRLSPSIFQATSQDTSSGTVFDFSDIPSWVKRITVVLDLVSLSGTDDLLVQIGTASGGIETSGYSAGSAGASISSSGFVIRASNATRAPTGRMVIENITGDTWVSTHVMHSDASTDFVGGGRKVLSGRLDRVRLNRTGSNTFDSGTVNVFYE